MKRLLVAMVLVLSLVAVSAQTKEPGLNNLETSRSVFALDVGFAGDRNSGLGYSVFIKSGTFIDESSFYYGFGSLLGQFVTTKESFFETGLLIGFTGAISQSNVFYDLFLDLLVTGGRIHGETSLYQAEAPALHLGMAIGFPASSNIDAALSIAPVIRPYSRKDSAWDFSRSYINLSLTLRMKSQMLGKSIPWSESYKTELREGEML